MYYIRYLTIFVYVSGFLNTLPEVCGGLCRNTSPRKFFRASGLVINIFYTILHHNYFCQTSTFMPGKTAGDEHGNTLASPETGPWKFSTSAGRLCREPSSLSSRVHAAFFSLHFPSLAWPSRRKRESYTPHCQ